MIYTLPPLTLALWIGEACTLGALSFLFSFCGYRFKYQRFAALIHFTTGGCVFLMVAATFASYPQYRWAYFIFRLAWDILAAFVAKDVYLNVFGPAWALPRSVPRRMAIHLTLIVSASAAVSGILRATAGSKALRYGTTAEGMLYGALAGTFFVLFILSHKLSITWHWRMRQIAGGMTLILVTNTFAAFARGHLTGILNRSVDNTGQAAYLFAFIFWGWCFLKAERPAPLRDPEILRSLAHRLQNAQSRAEALGIRTQAH